MEQFLEPAFLKFSLPLFSAVIAWFINEYRKQTGDEYQRKERKYSELLTAMKGFSRSLDSAIKESFDLKRHFVEQLDQCWLYCPDTVIKKGYAFLATVDTTKVSTEKDREKALGEFVVAIREDLFSHGFWRKTKLEAADFKAYFPAQQSHQADERKK